MEAGIRNRRSSTGTPLELLPGQISNTAVWREENLPEGHGPFRHLSTHLGGRRWRFNRCQASHLEEPPSGSSPNYHHPHSTKHDGGSIVLWGCFGQQGTSLMRSCSSTLWTHSQDNKAVASGQIYGCPPMTQPELRLHLKMGVLNPPPPIFNRDEWEKLPKHTWAAKEPRLKLPCRKRVLIQARRPHRTNLS